MKEGPLTGVATPVAFATSPARMHANAALLAGVPFAETRRELDAAISRADLNRETFSRTFGMLDTLALAAGGDLSVLEWRRNLPATSAWWFLLDRFLAREGHVGVAFLWPKKAPANAEDAASLRKAIAASGVEAKVSGWSFTLTELGPWAKSKLVELTLLMVGLNLALLLILFRSRERTDFAACGALALVAASILATLHWLSHGSEITAGIAVAAMASALAVMALTPRLRAVLVLMSGLAFAIAALFATLKVTGIALNLFNILAFPLVLGVGVDYGIYIALALRGPEPRRELSVLAKPVLLSALTTAIGFGSLAWAENPALSGLGLVCGIGVAWCLVSTFLFILPACALGVRTER